MCSRSTKIADVIPVFKAGDTKSNGNYRSISSLPVFSKVFERLMNTILMNYITEHNTLSNLQFGFRKGYSTEMATAVLIDNISKATDKTEHVIGVFFDFTKAFDPMINC